MIDTILNEVPTVGMQIYFCLWFQVLENKNGFCRKPETSVVFKYGFSHSLVAGFLQNPFSKNVFLWLKRSVTLLQEEFSSLPI